MLGSNSQAVDPNKEINLDPSDFFKGMDIQNFVVGRSMLAVTARPKPSERPPVPDLVEELSESRISL